MSSWRAGTPLRAPSLYAQNPAVFGQHPMLMNHPRQESEMKSSLLCVAHPSDVGGWEAFCLDFDLAVQGHTFDEAKDCLQKAIASYVEDAMKEDIAHRDRLLNRRAPFFVRVAWGWRFFLSTVRDRRDHNNKDVAVGFPVACPA